MNAVIYKGYSDWFRLLDETLVASRKNPREIETDEASPMRIQPSGFRVT